MTFSLGRKIGISQHQAPRAKNRTLCLPRARSMACARLPQMLISSSIWRSHQKTQTASLLWTGQKLPRSSPTQPTMRSRRGKDVVCLHCSCGRCRLANPDTLNLSHFCEPQFAAGSGPSGRVDVDVSLASTLAEAASKWEDSAKLYTTSAFVLREDEILNSLEEVKSRFESLSLSDPCLTQKKKETKWFCASVKDSGMGMKPEELTKMFEPYTQYVHDYLKFRWAFSCCSHLLCSVIP